MVSSNPTHTHNTHKTHCQKQHLRWHVHRRRLACRSM